MFSYSVSAAISYITGLFLSDYLYTENARLFLIFMTAFVLLPASFCYAMKKVYKLDIWILTIVPSLIFGGAFISGFQESRMKNPLSPFVGNEITVHGTVVSDVKMYETSCAFAVKTDSIDYDGKTYKIKNKIHATSNMKPSPGSGVILKGELKPVKKKLNSTSFDREKYYHRNGIYYSLHSDDIELAEATLTVFEKLSIFLRVKIAEYIDKMYTEEESSLIEGIILNNKSEIPDETSYAMQKSGIYRYIYSPYIHILFIIFLISFVTKKKNAKMAVLCCFLLIYLILNTGKPSAWKICIFTAAAYFVNERFGRKNIKVAIAVTVLIVAILSPLTVTDSGFIMSAAATVLISAFSKNLYGFFMRKLRHKKLSSSFSVFIIFTFLLSPLSQVLGYQLTPYSYFAGIILTPVICAIYVIFPINILIYILTGQSVNMGIPAILKFIKEVSEFISNMPGSRIVILPLGLFTTLSFYFVLYALYMYINKRRNYKIVMAVSLLAITISSAHLYMKTLYAEFTFVNVGQGDCCVIKLPDGQNIMIDGGGAPEYSDYNIGDAEVVPYLLSNGISKLDKIILSHYDKDHSQGVISAMKNIRVSELIMPAYAPNDEYRRLLENTALSENVRITFITETTDMQLGKDASAEFIYTDMQKNSKNANDCSLVTKFIYGSTTFLFTGDITRRVEAVLEDIDCDILKIPHHGSKTSTSERLLMKTTPRYSIFCLGKDNTYGFPHTAVVDRCRKYGTEMLRTDELGDIHFYLNKHGIKKLSSFQKK